jgi:predicted dienelactone hydrolase
MPLVSLRHLLPRAIPLRPLPWLAGLLTLLLPLAGLAADVTGVGIASIQIHDPVSGKMTDGYVFYPSSQPTNGAVALGPYHVAATPDAPAIPGPKPLVILSHGNGGSDLGHHDLASYLASHGFVVATLNHLGDYFRDTSGVGSIEVLAGRPIQVKATISTLLADPRWKALVDPGRIGVAGFSAGGYTSLMIAGAKPRFVRFIAFCDRYPDDKDVCGHRAEFEASAAKQGKTMAQVFNEMQGQLGRYGDTADPRVKAVFAMAPLSLIFDEHSFDNVHIPVYLYYGENDHVLPPEANAKHIQPLLPTLAGVKEIPKADHWVFLPPCSPELVKEIPAMCRDPQGVDRAKAHAQINADALAFFRKTLDMH